MKEFKGQLISLLYIVVMVGTLILIKNLIQYSIAINKEQKIELENNYIEVYPENKIMDLKNEDEFTFLFEGKNRITNEKVDLINPRYEIYGFDGNENLVNFNITEKGLQVKQKSKLINKGYVKCTINILADNMNPNTIFLEVKGDI